MNRNCILHPTQTLISFCQTCKDVACQLCTQLGPHADLRHQISTIQQAAIIRQQFYLVFRQKQINPLRERVSLKLLELTKKQEILANEKKVVEKDINLQFQGITTRVQQIVSKRIVKRQTQIKKLQEMINQIDDLTYSFDAVYQFPQMFLLCYKQFHQQLKTLQTLSLDLNQQTQDLAMKTGDIKAFENTWQVSKKQSQFVDLPREMALSFAKANQLSDYIQRNKFVNNLIGKSVEHYHQEIKKANKDVVAKQKKILHLYNDQNAELMALSNAMVCAFCLNAFTIAEANQACSHNKSYKAQPNYKDITIPVQLKGTKMHYWVAARKTQRPIPDLKAHSLIRTFQKKQYLASLKDLRQVKCKLVHYDIEKGTSNAYLKEFKKDDPEDKGKVSGLAFLYIMTNKFQISEVQVQALSQLCLCQEDGLVNYRKLQQILEDPLKLYKAFELQEEELEKSKPMAPPTLRFRY